MAVQPRISFITLGVDDLERAVSFYRDGLGLATAGIVGAGLDDDAVAFFELQPALTLALWPRASLARDTGLPVDAAAPTHMSLAHNVHTRDEVDTLLAQASAAGARIVKAASDTFYGGYAGYFLSPDGHLWEIAWNPKRLPPD
jgi:catechol 2,3-dioxygenase-like lactoylglutathione lyase family enzyme